MSLAWESVTFSCQRRPKAATLEWRSLVTFFCQEKKVTRRRHHKEEKSTPRRGAERPFSLMPRRCRGIRGDAPQGYLFRFAPLRGHLPLRKVYRESTQINIPRRSRGYLLYGRSPMLPATPHAALIRLAICIGCPPHTGINPSPFLSHIAVILNAYTFPSA